MSLQILGEYTGVLIPAMQVGFEAMVDDGLDRRSDGLIPTPDVGDCPEAALDQEVE